MQAQSVDLEFILPVANREHDVSEALGGIVARLAELSVPAGIAVVDRGSSDRTLDRVDALATGSPVPVRILGCSRPGWSAAALRGIVTTRARWVAFGEPAGAAELEHAVRLLAAGRHVIRAGPATMLAASAAEAIVRAAEPDGPQFATGLPDTTGLAGLRIAAVGRAAAPAPIAVETTALLDRVAV